MACCLLFCTSALCSRIFSGCRTVITTQHVASAGKTCQMKVSVRAYGLCVMVSTVRFVMHCLDYDARWWCIFTSHELSSYFQEMLSDWPVCFCSIAFVPSVFTFSFSLDLFHWSCLDGYERGLPANTAPAGYTCPVCNAGLFPSANAASPVVDALRELLSKVNWARAGLGLPLVRRLELHVQWQHTQL